MATKKRRKNNLSTFVLPSDNSDLLSFVKSHKLQMMEQAISSIEHAVENKLPIVEVFQFKDSKYVVTLCEREYLNNLNNILKFYLEKEMYELCSRITRLQNILNNDGNSIDNEKEQTKK